jgi:hypothetical protein
MLCGPTRPRAARRPPFVREQVPAHEHRLPPQVARSRFRGLFGRAPLSRFGAICHPRWRSCVPFGPVGE